MASVSQAIRRGAGACLVALGAFALSVNGPQLPAVASARTVIDAQSPIKHVVIIYQENHSFDDVLGQLCKTRQQPCDGFTGPVTFADGKTAPNVVEPDVVPGVDHNPRVAALARQNNWDQIMGCTTAPYACVTHIDPANIPNLAALANQFTVSDATYAAGDTVSFGAHLNLAAGTMDGFYGSNPHNSKTGATPHAGWGCPSNKDAVWVGQNGNVWAPTCVPDQSGAGPYRASPVPYVPTLIQNLEAAGLTWHIYQDTPNGSNTKPSRGLWSICTYFYWCYANRFTTTYDSRKADFVTAARNGTLPNVSYMLPVQAYSQHNNASMTAGDNYIGQMVSAVENGPEWDSTAIFITYDDCGCFYDHVPPPAGLGMRNPMVIISPYTKAGYTDSTTAVQPYSMLSFVDHAFGLPDLTPAVGNAYDYADSFDFTQTPLSGIPLTHRDIPKRERKRLAHLAAIPSVGDDPT